MQEKLIMITEKYMETSSILANLECELRRSKEENETHKMIENWLRQEFENMNKKLVEASIKREELINENHRLRREIRDLKNEIEQISEKSKVKVDVEK